MTRQTGSWMDRYEDRIGPHTWEESMKGRTSKFDRLQLIVGWTMTLVLVVWLAVILTVSKDAGSNAAITGGIVGAGAGVTRNTHPNVGAGRNPYGLQPGTPATTA